MSELIHVESAQNISLTGIHFENVTFSQIQNFAIFDILYSDNLKMTNLTMNNVELNEIKSVLDMNADSSSIVHIQMINLNNVMMYDSKIISAFGVQNLYIIDVKCFNTIKVDLNDDQSAILQISSQSGNEVDSLIINKLHSNYSNISLIRMTNLGFIVNSTISIFILNASYINSYNQFYDSIILLEEIGSESSVNITFDNIMFDNITFDFGGDLISFRQQCHESVRLSNIVVSNINYAGITISPIDTLNNSVMPHVIIHNIYVSYTDGMFKSFIKAENGAILNVRNSRFTHVSNIERGAVMHATGKDTLITVDKSMFMNNTSVESAVFLTEHESLITINKCNLNNNLAMSSTIIKAVDEGAYQMRG